MTPQDGNTVTRVLAATGAVTGTYAVGSRPGGIASDGTNIWVADFGSSNVTKMLAATGEIIGTYPLGGISYCLAYDGSNIWVSRGDSLVRLSASTGAITGIFSMAVATYHNGIAFDGTYIWAINPSGNSVTKLLMSGEVSGNYPTGTNPAGIAFDGSHIWVSNNGNGSISEY